MAVFGSDYATLDGSAVRDYIHVTDLAAAHVAALGNLERGGHSRSINLGTGRGASLARLDDRPVGIDGNARGCLAVASAQVWGDQ